MLGGRDERRRFRRPISCSHRPSRYPRRSVLPQCEDRPKELKHCHVDLQNLRGPLQVWPLHVCFHAQLITTAWRPQLAERRRPVHYQTGNRKQPASTVRPGASSRRPVPRVETRLQQKVTKRSARRLAVPTHTFGYAPANQMAGLRARAAEKRTCCKVWRRHPPPGDGSNQFGRVTPNTSTLPMTKCKDCMRRRID